MIDKNKIKKVLSRIMLCVLSAMLAVTAIPLTASAYDSKSEPLYPDEYEFIKSFSLKSKQQAVLEYIYADYMNGNDVYKGSGQCYGYAEKIRKLFGKKYKQRKYGVKPTPKNLYKKLKKLKPGTHVRFSATKSGGGRAHSIVLLKITKTEIWYTDGNVDWHGAIRYGRESLSSLYYRQKASGRKYLAWAREPKGSIPTQKKVKVKANACFDGPETHVAWLPVKGAKKYAVYRSASKSSGYVLLGETKKRYFIDNTSNLYGTAYYKIVAKKSGKKTATSKPVKVYRKLKSPVVYLTSDDYNNNYDLTWNAMPGAVRYKIYTWDYESKPKLLATVTGTSWRYHGKNDDYFELFITAEGSRSGSESYPSSIGIY